MRFFATARFSALVASLLLGACKPSESQPSREAVPSPGIPLVTITAETTQLVTPSAEGPSLPRVVLAGMRRTRSATTFRLEEQITGKGGLENMSLYMGLSDPNQVGLLLGLDLECAGTNCASHVTGGSVGILGVDPNLIPH